MRDLPYSVKVSSRLEFARRIHFPLGSTSTRRTPVTVSPRRIPATKNGSPNSAAFSQLYRVGRGSTEGSRRRRQRTVLYAGHHARSALWLVPLRRGACHRFDLGNEGA